MRLLRREVVNALATHIQLLAIVGRVNGQVDPTSSNAANDATTSIAQPTCESRTVNYITHTLPQQCHTSAPASIASITATGAAASQTASSTIGQSAQASATEEHELDSDGNDLSTGAFMSFEEWKEMMLKKSGQDNLENRPRKPHDGRGEAPGEYYDSLGEEGEISLDFDAYSDKISEITSASRPSQRDKEKAREDGVEKVSYDEGLGHGQVPRSKDAGKTCKERFSYSSFDAGAITLKTSPGTKNPKAILVENKDAYMLMECGTKNKFFIIELSDDILVDTVVLANFEFFSSMVRQFRVSVSDRYPAKLEKWKVLGEYQARNSRDIQPFLIENPQIWARYLRIEVLSHYGKEYYCPLSLLRVHGTRMLDSWKEQDPSDGDPELEAGEEPPQIPESANEHSEPESGEAHKISESAETQNQINGTQQSESVPFWDQSYFYYVYQVDSTCGLDKKSDKPSQTDPGNLKDDGATPAKPQPKATAGPASHVEPPSSSEASTEMSMTKGSNNTSSTSTREHPSNAVPSNKTTIENTATTSTFVSQTPQISTTKTLSSVSVRHSTTNASKNRSGVSTSLKPPSSKSTVSRIPSAGSSRNKTTSATTTAASASPTVQDSFFKQLTKRLQSLESNTTLSLQYIESQSKFLQEALAKLERRQLTKVDTFLNTLNKTVLLELREVRTQYDQIWQSTIIALETQRDQSQRENVALSGRLSLLADEVVFQKRMAIIQSILTLGCLVLVVFSRGLASAGMEMYYPSQLVGSTGRFASPLYPSTPKGLDRSARRDSTPQREQGEQFSDNRQNRYSSVDSTANVTPPRPLVGRSGTPDRRSQSYLSQSETHRPSASRSVSETTGMDYYQPPTPASLDTGYDSEPSNLPSSPKSDYFSTKQRSDIYREGTPAADEDITPSSMHDASSVRGQTPVSDVDSEHVNGIGTITYPAEGVSQHRGAARPPMSSVGSSRKPLPALPEDPD